LKAAKLPPRRGQNFISPQKYFLVTEMRDADGVLGHTLARIYQKGFYLRLEEMTGAKNAR